MAEGFVDDGFFDDGFVEPPHINPPLDPGVGAPDIIRFAGELVRSVDLEGRVVLAIDFEGEY